MNIRILLVAVLSALLTACGGSSGSSTADACADLATETFSCENMLEDIVNDGVLPLIQNLETALINLDDKVVAYCGEISNAAKLSDAESAWTAAMVSMQQLLPMNFGPNSDAGNGLTTFYDWQTASPYNIDIAIAQRSRFPETVTLPVASNEKDLVAIEYVLFDIAAIQEYDNPANENDNVKAWREGKTDDQIQQDRCDYAALVTTSLEEKAIALKASWQQLDLVSESNNKQSSANEIAKALFYIDKVTKDAKIKALLPQVDDPATGFDVDKVESQFAKESSDAILNNLIGAKILLTLNDTDDSKTGLDDYLKAAGQQDVADEMIAALDLAIANVQEINGSIYDAVNGASDETECKTASGNGTYLEESSDIVTFCALQYQVKTFTDILKGDFTILTSFTIPANASGDND